MFNQVWETCNHPEYFLQVAHVGILFHAHYELFTRGDSPGFTKNQIWFYGFRCMFQIIWLLKRAIYSQAINSWLRALKKNENKEVVSLFTGDTIQINLLSIFIYLNEIPILLQHFILVRERPDVFPWCLTENIKLLPVFILYTWRVPIQG